MHRISNKLIYTYWMGCSNIDHPSLSPFYFVNNEWCICILEYTLPVQKTVYPQQTVFSILLFWKNWYKSTILWYICRGFLCQIFILRLFGLVSVQSNWSKVDTFISFQILPHQEQEVMTGLISNLVTLYVPIRYGINQSRVVSTFRCHTHD